MSAYRTSYYANTRKEMLPFVPAGARDVLEIGCGCGNFGELLQEMVGCRVTGVEPVPEAYAVARTRLHRAWLGTVESFLSVPGETYDAICFNDVLEHLMDPWTPLQRCGSFLREGGVVVASIPNIRSFPAVRQIVWEGEWRYEDAGIFDRTHLRFFTKKSAVRLFEECAFAVRKCEGINPLKSRRYRWLNRITLGCFEEWFFPQFAIVAALRK